MNDAVKITLTHPLKLGSIEISELTLCRPKARHFRLIKPGSAPMAMLLDLAAALSGVPDNVIDELDGVDDLPKVIEAVSGFLEQFPATGLMP